MGTEATVSLALLLIARRDRAAFEIKADQAACSAGSPRSFRKKEVSLGRAESWTS